MSKYGIPKFLSPYVYQVRKNNKRFSIDIKKWEYSFPTKSCKDCNHFIPTDNDIGICYHHYLYTEERRKIPFSNHICKNFDIRTCPLDKFCGKDRHEVEFEKSLEKYTALRCESCGSSIIPRIDNSLSCKCGKVKIYPKEVRV